MTRFMVVLRCKWMALEKETLNKRSIFGCQITISKYRKKIGLSRLAPYNLTPSELLFNLRPPAVSRKISERWVLLFLYPFLVSRHKSWKV